MATGRLFHPESKEAVICDWRVEASELILTPARQPDSRSWRIPLARAELSLGGFNDDQIVLKADELTFYCERAVLAPQLLKTGYRYLVEKLAGERRRVAHSVRRSWVLLAVFCVFCGLGGWFVWFVSDRVVDQAARLSPVRWDVELGNAVYGAIAGASRDVTDPRIVGPVTTIVEELSRPYADQGFIFQVHVLESDQVNAFALPGGQIAVYTGLLRQADGPDELAGVLAHEIQHVVNRHGLRGIYGALRWQIALAVLVGDTSSLHGQLLGSGVMLATRAYGREMESEADRKGAELLRECHYPAGGMVKFFKKMEARQGATESALKYLSTHPTSKERIANLQRLLGDSPAEGEIPVDWASLQAALKAEAPKEPVHPKE